MSVCLHTTEGNASILKKDTVLTGNLLGLVGDDGDVHLTQTALLAGSVDPGKVGELCQKKSGQKISTIVGWRRVTRALSIFLLSFFFLYRTRVGGSGNNLAVQSLELLNALGEGEDLGGADEGEVHGVPEEHNVLALVVGQGNILELTVDNGGEGELGSGLLDLSNCNRSQ